MHGSLPEAGEVFSGEAVRPTISSAVLDQLTLDQLLVEVPLDEPEPEPEPELLGAGAAAGAEVVEEPESDEPPDEPLAGVLLDEPAASELLVDEVDELLFELPPRLSVL
jgi:hypothetical protein